MPGKRSVAVSSRRGPIITAGDEHSEYWDHLWIYFIPRPYWIDWLKWDQTTHGIGKTTINDPDQLQQLRDLFYEVIRHHSASVPLSEALAMNALERLILRCFQQQPISNPPCPRPTD
ncbi:Arabinose operon regulatory protein [Klebsiella pneumoniae]|uniref:Arabinose operon regulatory protein n=1 Tax=Klebsiella pneumoniae TaxID=573 RepID=A0A3S4KGZ8_KLEPN|nr:Arabinose operon regulatory protein [Klebsiella pneumoniae]